MPRPWGAGICVGADTLGITSLVLGFVRLQAVAGAIDRGAHVTMLSALGK
jgi:hypothetical protein